MEVVIPYAPREVFKPFHNRTQRWAALVAHRRCGKTVACINDLIRDALTLPNKPPCAYVAPYYAQAKDVAWGYVKEFTSAIPGVEYNESELRCELPNGGRVRLYGADNYDRMRGLSLASVVLDEYADMDPRAWSEVIRPALADRQGKATFIGTPKGRNAFWEVFDNASRSDDWFSLVLRASETGILPESELADAKRGMSNDQYNQEFECSFQAAIVGAYFGKELSASERENRITRVPWEAGSEVHTAWDLGISDSTAIWFIQRIGRETRVIDYYENSGCALDHYANILKQKPYSYGKHYLPHDTQIRELGTGKSRVETLASLGIRATVVKADKVEDGINQVRKLLPTCWFDAEKCKRGIEALRQYRTEYDDKLKAFKNRPLHDWTSHGADAFRTFAMGHRDKTEGRWEQPDVKWIV